MIRIIALSAALLMAGTTTQASAGDPLAGGLLGAGAGAVLGGALTGRGGGALAGAAIGGATGAIIASESDRRPPRRVYREEPGVYFSSRGRCYYEYPDGGVQKVSNHPC